MEKELLEDIQKRFLIRKIKTIKPITAGNINSTYRIEAKGANYILQKINKFVFKHPEEVMQNIRRINRHLEQKVLLEDGNPKKEVLHPIDTRDGTKFFVDENGDYWRIYDWIEGARTYDSIEQAKKYVKIQNSGHELTDKEKTEEVFKKVGVAFGKFQKRLADYPTEDPVMALHEAIPNFHNTPDRYSDLEWAIKLDKAGRLKAVEDDEEHPLNVAIAKIRSYKEKLERLELGKRAGELPIRVTHNDTKINNVMIDVETGEAICVIDLDTVGPDTALVDFGDAIRSGANPAGEEPENINDAELDLGLFKAYTRGYLQETLAILENGKINNNPKSGLTKNEVVLLHKAPQILTLELAMRFITDYLNGDEYFKLKEGQPGNFNLKRGLVQLHLAEDMIKKEKEMQQSVRDIVIAIRGEALKNKKTTKVDIDDDYEDK